MTKLFDAYVVVDWHSGAKPATGANSVWICTLKKNVRFALEPKLDNPATRAQAEQIIDAALAELAKRGDRVFIGFDFSLGFPRGTASRLKLKGAPAWRAMFDFLSAEIKDRPDNANNRFQVAAKINRLMSGEAFPFWGCPPKDVLTTLSSTKARPHGPHDPPEHRHADLAAKGAQAIWKLYGAGAVGGQSLVGIPMVARLRAARGDAARLWPFETGWRALSREDLDGVQVVMAEVYPSLVAGKPGPGEVKDAAQVRAMAEHVARLDAEGRLAAAFGPRIRPDFADTVEAEEGWILGA